MITFIRSVSRRTEIVTTLTLAFGYFVFASLLRVSLGPVSIVISNDEIGFLLAYELAILVLLCGFLRVRGWSFADVGLEPRLRGIVEGAVLWGVVLIATWIVASLAVNFSPEVRAAIMRSTFKGDGLQSLPIVALSIVNPLFEELFVCGYLITALRGLVSPTMAINASVCLRLAYHLYQGPVGVVSIIPAGLIFAYWFTRTGRLWPIIVAHATDDLLSLTIGVSS